MFTLFVSNSQFGAEIVNEQHNDIVTITTTSLPFYITTTTTEKEIPETINEIIETWIPTETPELVDRNISIFCAESMYGIVNEPSYSVTWADGTYVDKCTGIRMNEQGDYICAMGQAFGECGDRFEIQMKLANGNDKFFTVQIGDSKGDRWYHEYAHGTEFEGYCVIEFIVDMSVAGQYINYTGSYHFLDDFNGEIVLISKICKV